MALTDQQKNHISRLMQLSETALILREDILQSRAEWDQNDMFNQMTTEEIQEIQTFAHLDISKIANAIGALDDVTTALGDYVTGEAVNLVKMRG